MTDPTLVKRLRSKRANVVCSCQDLREEAADRIEELEAAIVGDLDEGKKEVDRALREFGYDSIRFADVRHGWIRGTRRIRSLFDSSSEPETDDNRLRRRQ